MQTFISILRGINVSGQKKILMKDLKAVYENLNLSDVVTYIQSGNVIFNNGGNLSDTELAETIGKAIYKSYNFHVPVVIRSMEEMKKIISSNPFLPRENIDPKKLHVTFLSEIPDKKNARSVENMDFTPDQFRIAGRNIYLYVPNSYGETKISNAFFEKKLNVTATTRNWNSVNKLFEIAAKNQLD